MLSIPRRSDYSESKICPIAFVARVIVDVVELGTPFVSESRDGMFQMLAVVNIICAAGGLVAGLTAAWYLYAASGVPLDPGWGADSLREPVLDEHRRDAWMMEMLTASAKANRLNRIAAQWTAAAVILASASALIGAFSQT